jgi:DNA-binding MarR family transcriptional regulator
MTDISGYMSVTPRSITKLVDSLEVEGLVVREPHPQDRRATIIRITPQGMLVCKESAMANHAAITSLYEHLDLKERQQLAQILQKLIGALNDEARAEQDRGMT